MCCFARAILHVPWKQYMQKRLGDKTTVWLFQTVLLRQALLTIFMPIYHRYPSIKGWKLDLIISATPCEGQNVGLLMSAFFSLLTKDDRVVFLTKPWKKSGSQSQSFESWSTRVASKRKAKRKAMHCMALAVVDREKGCFCFFGETWISLFIVLLRENSNAPPTGEGNGDRWKPWLLPLLARHCECYWREPSEIRQFGATCALEGIGAIAPSKPSP